MEFEYFTRNINKFVSTFTKQSDTNKNISSTTLYHFLIIKII